MFKTLYLWTCTQSEILDLTKASQYLWFSNKGSLNKNVKESFMEDSSLWQFDEEMDFESQLAEVPVAKTNSMFTLEWKSIIF